MDTAALATNCWSVGTPYTHSLILLLIIMCWINRLSIILWPNISVYRPLTRGLGVVNIYSIIYKYSQRSDFDSILCTTVSHNIKNPLTVHLNYAVNGRSAPVKQAASENGKPPRHIADTLVTRRSGRRGGHSETRWTPPALCRGPQAST